MFSSLSEDVQKGLIIWFIANFMLHYAFDAIYFFFDVSMALHLSISIIAYFAIIGINAIVAVRVPKLRVLFIITIILNTFTFIFAGGLTFFPRLFTFPFFIWSQYASDIYI